MADDVHQEDFKGHGNFLALLCNRPPLHDVQIDHVTAFVPGVVVSITNKGEKLNNFSLTNSVIASGEKRPSLASAGGGPANCATKSQRMGAEAVLKECFATYRFDKNLMIGGRGTWPSGTIAVSSREAAGIRSDLGLCSEKGSGCAKASPGAGAAPGGRDIGADVQALEATLTGVE